MFNHDYLSQRYYEPSSFFEALAVWSANRAAVDVDPIPCRVAFALTIPILWTSSIPCKHLPHITASSSNNKYSHQTPYRPSCVSCPRARQCRCRCAFAMTLHFDWFLTSSFMIFYPLGMRWGQSPSDRHALQFPTCRMTDLKLGAFAPRMLSLQIHHCFL
jgi:hypothetical protein